MNAEAVMSAMQEAAKEKRDLKVVVHSIVFLLDTTLEVKVTDGALVGQDRENGNYSKVYISIADIQHIRLMKRDVP